MSVVGPRPYMLSDCRLFADLVPDSAFRYRVKPGITGMAQAKGLHGSVVSDRRVIFLRYEWDEYYVRHAGLALDIDILRKTVGLMLSGGKRR